MSKAVAELLFMLAETEKRRKRCEAIAAAIRTLEERAESASGEEKARIYLAIAQGKKLLEAQ